MSLLYRHRRGHILALLVVLFAAVSFGNPAGDAYSRSTCQPEPSTCGHLSVWYPFHLYNGTEEAQTVYGEPRPFCGYPGLGIVCDDDRPILRLGGDNYAVLAINHTSLTVSLADADVAGDGTSCPTVRHNVTVPNPFRLATSTVAYLLFFADCRFAPDADFAPRQPHKPSSIKPITCGSSEADSNSTTMSFVLPEREVPPKDWWRACRSVYSAPVLRDAIPADAQDAGWRGGGYAKALRGGFQVSLDQSFGPCARCEQSSGRCGYNDTGGFLGCLCANGALVGSDGCSKISDSAAPQSGNIQTAAVLSSDPSDSSGLWVEYNHNNEDNQVGYRAEITGCKRI